MTGSAGLSYCINTAKSYELKIQTPNFWWRWRWESSLSLHSLCFKRTEVTANQSVLFGSKVLSAGFFLIGRLITGHWGWQLEERWRVIT